MEWWRIIVEYFTPDSLREDWEGMRRLRLLVGLSLLGLALGGMYGVFYWSIGHRGGAAIIAVCIVLQVSVPFLIRATGRVSLGGHLSLAVWGFGFTGIAAVGGGIHAFSIAWLACGGPLLALFILDRPQALFWCLFCILSTLFYSVLELANITLPLTYATRWQPEVLVAGISGLVVFMSLMGILFEYSRSEAVLGMQASLKDVSEANERTQQSERFLQRIADTIPGFIYMFDIEERTIVYANEHLVRLLGLTPVFEEGIKISGLSKSAALPDLEAILEGARNHLRDVKEGAVIQTEYTFEHDGVETYWDCRDTVFSRIPTGEPLCILGLAVDITEQKRTERARSAAEGANRAKDQFLAVLSHELRTPLTPVMATVSEMEAQETLPAELRADMVMIRRNVEMEAKLIEDLLDVTRISSGKLVLRLETVDAHSCLRSALEICRAEIETKELQVTADLGATQHSIHADPVRMRQVFWNLLRNAVKFTPPGGQIHLGTNNVGDKLRIEITDSGVGIEPAVLPRIFNLFEQGEQTRTRRFGGLGLGLNIARKLVEMHHGQLTAASKGKGKGATFTVELASVAAAQQQPTPQVTSKPGIGKMPKILLVEDDPDTRRTLCKLLQRHGYEVTSSDCVQKSLEILSMGGFDLVISDLGLPDGSGLELMRQIKTVYHIPGIALSGYGAEEDVRQSRAAGFEQHITKPVNFDALRAAIQQTTRT